MKFKDYFRRPIFWKVISGIYLVLLFLIILVYNPDFLEIRNCLLFVPLYIPLVIASYLQHKNYKDDMINRWTIEFSLITVTAIVVVFKIIVDYFK